MNLIPLSEYVLQEKRKMIEAIEEPGTTSDAFRAYSNFVEKIISYTDFLRQPLTLGMFVPVDDECHIVSNVVTDSNYFGIHIYEKAKKRVLFEGFSFKNKVCMYHWGCINVYRFSNGNVKFFGIDYSEEDRPSFWLKTIEDLINLHDIILTPSALKLIGKKE